MFQLKTCKKGSTYVQNNNDDDDDDDDKSGWYSFSGPAYARVNLWMLHNSMILNLHTP
jgi:hypothetical protein